jgi:hypothetical protein
MTRAWIMSIASDIGTRCVFAMPAFAADYSGPTKGDAPPSSEVQSPWVGSKSFPIGSLLAAFLCCQVLLWRHHHFVG